ncbi:MAG TPA: NAD+ synthase [Alphaproteobacteria bacterium]|nr:NAD+ synthase [Alphaproteobacteria bacterium]HBF97848.1 NAD+ synthase [Alphaproteobacteria bacterium]
MTDRLKIALVQYNPVVGDVAGNSELARRARAEAAQGGADLVVFSELFLIGYPPEDLVRKPAILEDVVEAVASLAAETADGGPALLIGAPVHEEGRLYNAMLLLDGGECTAWRAKYDLPNYGVFDEKRVFDAGPMPGPVNFRGVRLGIPICEDIWGADVVECLQETGAEMLVVANGSPYEVSKLDQRMSRAVARVTESGLPMIYVNQYGGQDELVFDGGSFVLNADRTFALQMPFWQTGIAISDWQRTAEGWRCAEGEKSAPPEELGAIYQAMMLGLRDYVNKNGFPGVVLGMSGGIDSALSAAVAADALGPERVRCVMLPSRYTSEESLQDAAECAGLIGARLDSVSIAPAVDAFDMMLSPLFEGRNPDLTEENIQSRARAVVLMALSNKFGDMVLTTGNKSEVSVGYATLYGDMCGGYNALKDIYKMTVFKLCHWRNQHFPEGALGSRGRVIPENIIIKPPTAELRPDQKDEDSLPPYAALDDMLDCLVEREMSFEEVVARGHAPETVKRVEHLLYVAEYKRRQAAPGVKISMKSFGRDRRYPITNRFRDAR